MNIFTYGGTEVGQFPLSIYPSLLRHLFTFLIPIACVNYLPATLLFGHESVSPAFWFLPLVGVIFLASMLQFWEFGVKHYRSTGS
jgi:ABC-2 type transport system permease protein